MQTHEIKAGLVPARLVDPRDWGNRREESDGYSGEIAQHGKHRVILCRDGIQWIIQRKGGSRRGSVRWRSLSYCTTKKALLRLWATVEPDAAALQTLTALPEYTREIVGGAQ